MGDTGHKGSLTRASVKAKVEVSVPTILRDCTGGCNPVTIEAATLAEALARLRETYPLLRRSNLATAWRSCRRSPVGKPGRMY
jgi:hypothetical protein